MKEGKTGKRKKRRKTITQTAWPSYHSSSTIVGGTPGVLHGTKTFLMQNKAGQVVETHSISAGLDYPGVGPGEYHVRGDT